MRANYVRAAIASLALTGCGYISGDFSDCGIKDIAYCIRNNSSPQQEERQRTQWHLMDRLMRNHPWDVAIDESIGCGEGDSKPEARYEAWRSAHRKFDHRYGNNTLRSEITFLEETLRLSKKKYVACAEVIGVESQEFYPSGTKFF